MSGDGAFDDLTRAAILGRTDGRCAGCGASDTITCQHRIARGMGGRSRGGALLVSHAAAGLALCGSGTTGCHGWAEHHPNAALALGWRLPPGTDPIGAPYWTVAGPFLPWAACDEEGLLVWHDGPRDEADVDAANVALRAYLTR